MVKTPLSQERILFILFIQPGPREMHHTHPEKCVCFNAGCELSNYATCSWHNYNPVYPVRSNKPLILFITAALRCQNTSGKHHNTLSHLKIGKAAQGPCDFLCSHEGQTLLLQSQWIYAGSLYFHPQCCPCLGDQEEYPLYVESWSSSMLGPSLWNGEKAWKSSPPLITSF